MLEEKEISCERKHSTRGEEAERVSKLNWLPSQHAMRSLPCERQSLNPQSIHWA